MQAGWSAECGANDPVLVVPWDDPANPASHYVDLREDPYELDHIPEAEAHPALLQALRALNATRSPVFTAKCDAWLCDADELDTIQAELDLPEAEAAHGFASYIDLLFRDRTLFLSFHAQAQRLDRLQRLLEPLDLPNALAEATLRPALIDLVTPDFSGPAEGFAVTLYLRAVGHDRAQAYERWSRAMDALVVILRSKELSVA
jgi:hypothetical protein